MNETSRPSRGKVMAVAYLVGCCGRLWGILLINGGSQILISGEYGLQIDMSK